MKRAALFVGINDYIKPLASLTCARRDADTLYGLFLKEYTHGMVDYLHDVNSDEIIKSIEKTMESLTEGDLFFFYFSGHGIEERNNHLLLTSGARQLGDEWHHALSVNKLKYLTQKPGVQTVFVIDSCRESVYHGARSAGVAEQSRGATMKKLVEKEASNAVMLPPVILCSCAGGERAFEIENEGHGIFTLALKECLESKAFFTLDEIAQNVTERLKSFISKHNFSGHQTPELHKSPGVNPVLWGNPDTEKVSAAENAKLDKEYGKLYGRAEVLSENGRFSWQEEFRQRLESCERIYETGLTQDAIDALNDLFDWHKKQKSLKAKQENEHPAEVKHETESVSFTKSLRFTEAVSSAESVCVTGINHSAGTKKAAEAAHVAEAQKTANAERVAELKQFDNEIKEIEKKWQKKEQTKQPEIKQPEAEKKLSWGQRIWGFFADYLLSFFFLFLSVGSVMAAIKKDGITADDVGYTLFLLLYLILLLCRKYWYFVLCNLFMGVLCLSLFLSPWWWFACVPAAFIVFCVLCSDDVSEKNKKCKFVYIYLGGFQAISLLFAFDSGPLMICGLYGTLFFPLIYTYPKFISLLTAVTCGVLAFTWSLLWWIGVALFLFILLGVWGNENEKKEKNKGAETQKQ